MKSRQVLFLTSSAPRTRGDSTAPFILNMARDLCDLGWRVEILAPHAPGLRKFETIDGVRIRRFQYMWPASWQSLCYGGGAALNLKRHRLNWLAVPFLVCAEFLSAFIYLLRHRPALIHSHWVIPQGVVGQALTFLGLPHVITVHGTDIYGFRGRLMRAIKAWSLRHCDHVIANSTSTKVEIEALCQPKALSIVPTGTSRPSNEPRSNVSNTPVADPGAKTILFVGRLIEAKGVRYLIEALSAILVRQRARLLVVGDGPERQNLEELARSLNLVDYVVFVGSVPHSVIYDYFSIADVFVGPSINIPGESAEAQGNTFAEALFAGVPVVASRVGGIPDTIIHERTGLLVDERAPDQIADSVLRILFDPHMSKALIEEGLIHAERNFLRFESARKLDVIYRAILGSRGAR